MAVPYVNKVAENTVRLYPLQIHPAKGKGIGIGEPGEKPVMAAAGKMHSKQGERRSALSADFIVVHHHIPADTVAAQPGDTHAHITSTDKVPGNAEVMAAADPWKIFVIGEDTVREPVSLADRVPVQIIVQDLYVAASEVELHHGAFLGKELQAQVFQGKATDVISDGQHRSAVGHQYAVPVGRKGGQGETVAAHGLSYVGEVHGTVIGAILQGDGDVTRHAALPDPPQNAVKIVKGKVRTGGIANHVSARQRLVTDDAAVEDGIVEAVGVACQAYDRREIMHPVCQPVVADGDGVRLLVRQRDSRLVDEIRPECPVNLQTDDGLTDGFQPHVPDNHLHRGVFGRVEPLHAGKPLQHGIRRIGFEHVAAHGRPSDPQKTVDVPVHTAADRAGETDGVVDFQTAAVPPIRCHGQGMVVAAGIRLTEIRH